MSLSRAPMRAFLRRMKKQQDEMVALLGRFVKCESPSHDKAAVDAFGRIVAEEWKRRGAKVQFFASGEARQPDPRGNMARRGPACWANHGARASRYGLSRGHFGHDAISCRARASVRSGNIRHEKAGLVLALFALDSIRAAGLRPRKRIVFMWNSDEEIGSTTSRAAIEREARRSDAVLVLEPSLGSEGRLKTARKGVGTAEIIVTGRAAHAGINPAAGVNAVHELALQIARLMKMNDPRRGITVQATVIAGGTVSNVVPAQARAEVDIRYARASDAPAIDRAFTQFASDSEGRANRSARRNQSPAT